MPNYRKVARDALHAAMADATTGFNAQLAALAVAYGVTPFTIDWTAGSTDFVMSYLNPAAVDVSGIVEYPAAVLYGSRAVDEKKIKSFRFSGQVLLSIDFYLTYRALRELHYPDNDIDEEAVVFDTESIADAVEDAALEAIRAGGPHFGAVGQAASAEVVHADYSADRDVVVPHGDGYSQRVRLTVGFNIHTR